MLQVIFSLTMEKNIIHHIKSDVCVMQNIEYIFDISYLLNHDVIALRVSSSEENGISIIFWNLHYCAVFYNRLFSKTLNFILKSNMTNMSVFQKKDQSRLFKKVSGELYIMFYVEIRSHQKCFNHDFLNEYQFFLWENIKTFFI